MALTETRWMGTVVIVFLLATAASLAHDRAAPLDVEQSAEQRRLNDLQRQVGRASVRWQALARRDSVVAALPSPNVTDAHAPLLAIDPRLPATHRSMIERAVRRRWTSLQIDSARVPVAIAVVIDTSATGHGRIRRSGEIAFDYMLPDASAPGPGSRCTVIATVQSRSVVRPGSQRSFNELIATPRSASALLGPCAFAARFGAPGAQIDRWLRLRSYDLAAHPLWRSVPGDAAEGVTPRWARATAGTFPEVGNPGMLLSPAALGCAAGATERCGDALDAPADLDTTPAAGLVIAMEWGRDPHWRSMSSHYLSDLVTALGPERFERFWRSDRSPDGALRAIAGIPLNAWTQTWAGALLGHPHFGPAVSLTHLVSVLTLAGVCLALAAWGWTRRQVR